MDTLTQIALGTTIAEAFFRHSLGRRALFFGAFCGWFPDIDVFFHTPQSWEGLVAHRGLTHSILFLPLLAPILGEIGFQLGKTNHRKNWIMLAFWALITHPLLDVCTSYGTQLFAPISNDRYSTDAIAIIDLFYSAPLFYACYWALSRNKHRPKARTIAQAALGVSTLYLGCCHVISQVCFSRAEILFKEQDFIIENLRVNPPMLLPFLRRAIAHDSQGNLITTAISVLSSQKNPIDHYDWNDDALIQSTLASTEGQIFQWFADDFVRAYKDDSKIVLTDARYGLYLNPWWSPFSATASITNEQTGKLQRSGRPNNINYSQELQRGWHLMWGY